jgi:hypothetical protein
MASLLLQYRTWDGIYKECENCTHGEAQHEEVKILAAYDDELIATGVWNWDLRIMCATEPVS